MSRQTSHAERVNSPAMFYAGHGVSVKVWPANGNNKYPQAVIEQSYQKEDSDDWRRSPTIIPTVNRVN